MPEVAYPTALHSTYYALAIVKDELVPERLTSTLYRRRADAEYAFEQHMWSYLFTQNRRDLASALEIVVYDTVYLPRCGICADRPVADNVVYTDWWQMREALTEHFGWAATSEQEVFCPCHRPDNEE